MILVDPTHSQTGCGQVLKTAVDVASKRNSWHCHGDQELYKDAGKHWRVSPCGKGNKMSSIRQVVDSLVAALQ